MPFIYDKNIVAVEKEEICLEYWNRNSEQYLRAKRMGLIGDFWSKLKVLQVDLYRHEHKPYGVKRLTRGGNGRRLLVNYDTLPAAVQDFLGDPRKCDNPLEKHFTFSGEANAYYSTFKRNGRYLSAVEQERYIINASVLDAAIQLEAEKRAVKISMGGSLRGMINEICGDVVNFNKWLSAKHNVTHNLPSNSRRFGETFRAYKEQSHYVLIKDPEGKSVQNARIVDERAWLVLNGLFQGLDHKPSKAETYRIYDSFLNGYTTVYNEETGELFDPKEFSKLSPSTVSAYLDAWDSKIATYNKRSGNRQTYQERFIPHTQMEMPKLAGSIISIDDRQPPFWYDKGKRMWFYIGIDIASRAVTTFVYGKSKTGIILDFYRQMVRNYHELGLNLPAELEAESALNSSFKNTFLQEGKMFKHVKIHANNARGKYIERVFGKVRYGIEKKSPGFIARPFARFEHNQSGPNSNKIIPYDDLVLARLKDLEDYNNQPHPTEPGVSRWEYFLNNQDPNLPPTNYAAIIPYLGRKTETSCKAGYVKLSNSKRALAMDGKILTGAELINAMRQIEGKNIDVYWLDANDGSIIKAYAYYKGRMVCELMEMPKFNRSQNERTAQDREAESLQMSYINTVIGFAKTQAAQIDDLGIIDNTPKPKRLFKINNVERYEATEDYYDVEVVDEINEDDEEILYNPSTGHDYEADKERWKKQFIDQTL